jgi:MoaA/NifB/PqqE/SkfB family radical SAM enzyme
MHDKLTRLGRMALFSPGLIFGNAGSAGLMLTRRCNMACPYCHIRDNQSDHSELPAVDWVQILLDLHRFGIRQIVLTGGEPTLHPEIVTIAQHARSQFLVSMVSNGILLMQNPMLAENLLPLLDVLSLSVDYFVLGNGDLDTEKLSECAQILSRHHLPRECILTISRESIEAIPRWVEALAGIGFSSRLSLVHGNGSHLHQFRGEDDHLAPDNRDVKKLDEMVTRVLEIQAKHGGVADSRDFLLGIPRFVEGSKTLSCPAGRGVLEIDSTGAVQACQDCSAIEQPLSELVNRSDVDTLLRNSIPSGCRCHYSHYHRISSYSRRLGNALARLKALRRPR